MSTSVSQLIASRLREQRLRLGWTQEELGSRAGMATVTVRRFEKTGGITLDRLLALTAALGMDLQLAASGASVIPDPGAVRVRQRGVRRRR